MLIGYLASLFLIVGGIWLTQRDIDVSHIPKNSSTGEVSAKLGQFEFVAKNTAPGIVLILCGTWIAVTTIQRKSHAKTQWADERIQASPRSMANNTPDRAVSQGGAGEQTDRPAAE
jgi:hypothetical protein